MSSPLLRPRWLIGHVIVVITTVGFTLLGFWQLDRHGGQRVDNRLLEQVLAAPPMSLSEAILASDQVGRRVTVTGRYDYPAQLELRPRFVNGRPGYEQIVPLDAGEDGVVLVNRGFIPDTEGRARQFPGGVEEVTVNGTLRVSQGTSRFGPQNAASGVLETIARIDLDRLQPQFGGNLAGVYLDLIDEQPPAGGFATELPPPPAPTSRPHFLYSLQWWALAAISSIGWVIFLRKQFGGR